MKWITLFTLGVLLPMAIAKVTRQQSHALREVCVKMVNYVFPEKYCLYYISDAVISEVPFVDFCLKHLNVPLVLMDPENAETRPGRKRGPSCNGYLVVSGNYHVLKKIFTYNDRERDFEFRTHKRILILYIGRGDFMAPPFTYVANLKGNDIIVVDDLPDYQRDLEQYVVFYKGGEFVREAQISDANVSVRISSVRENMVLVDWRYVVEPFDEDVLKFSTWKPNFRDENKTFKVSCFHCPPYVYVNSKNQAYDGINYQIVNLIANQWPVTYHPDNYSVYNDMFGRLIRRMGSGRFDLGACIVWLRTPDTFGAELSTVYSENCYTFLVPKPRLIKRTWFVFHTLHALSWILIAIITVIMAILIKLSSKSMGDHDDFVYALLQSIRVISLGPINRFPAESYFVFRAILAIWLCASVILTTGYNAGFSSVLTYPTYSEEIKTIKEMIAQDILWGHTTTSLRDDLELSGDPGIVKLVDNFRIEKDIGERNARIRSNKYAVSTKRISKQYVTGTEFLDEYARNNLKVLRECYSKNVLVYAFSPNSPYRDIFNKRLLRVIEGGLFQLWTDRILEKYKVFYVPQSTNRISEITSSFEPLDLTRLRGCFYLLLIGHAVSIAVFIVEYWYDVYMKKNEVYSARNEQRAC